MCVCIDLVIGQWLGTERLEVFSDFVTKLEQPQNFGAMRGRTTRKCFVESVRRHLQTT